MTAPGAQLAAGCPDENALMVYLEGALGEAAREALRVHLDGCDECREVAAALVRAQVPAERDPDTPERLPRGWNVGRYVVLEPIGRGAMGTVYSAFDPELDRKVAIKVLSLRNGLDEVGSRGRELLVAEAQAIARLSHPNVIAVHDVGTFDGEVFFAMELVRGTTLREAVERAPGFRRILALFSAAGEGLAAAHEGGIVHRDFKPENVLVSDDGRVRVTDFGLAAPARAGGGHRVGTPAYMAPEQWRGERADARSDQYSFCAALHEALDPSARTPGAAARRWVPPRVARVLARGLRERPDERWPSMRALLDALSQAARPWRPSTLAACVALMLLALGVSVRHELSRRAADRELELAARRLVPALSAQRDLADARIRNGLRAPVVLEAFQSASDLDAALGLAPAESADQALSDAHALLRSADLAELKGNDLLLFVDTRGRVVFNLADPARFGEPAPAPELIARAMRGTTTDELWSPRRLERMGPGLTRSVERGGLLWVLARPVVRAEAVVGTVLLGRWVDPQLMSELSHAAGARIALRAPDGGWVGTALQGQAAADGRLEQLHLDGHPVAAVGVRPETLQPDLPASAAFVLRELDPLPAARHLRQLLLALGIGALLWLGWRTWRFS